MNTILFLRKYIAAIFLFAAVVTASSNLSAQGRIDQFLVTTFSTPFTSIVGQAGTIGLGMQGCYYCVSTVSMPFNFNFDGTTISANSTVYISAAGSVDFTSDNSSYYSRVVPYFGGTAKSYPMSICPMTGLQYPIGAGGVFYQTSGVAPNRVFTVEWNQMQDYWNGAKITSYQAKLYETSNQIEFWYKDWNYAIGNEQSSYYHNVGLNGSLTPSFLQVIIIGGTTNFNTPTANYRFSFVPPVELSVTPKSLVYGAVLAGSSVTLCATATHAGTAGILTFNSASITGSSDFSIVSSPAGPLSPGQTDQYCVKFAPSGAGVRTATLTIVTNGRDSGIQSVALNGTGLYPLISVDSTVLFKKTRTSMGQTLTQWAHITNTGQAPLFISGIPITGIDADQYSIIHLPVNPIPVGVTDSLGITYTPTREGLHVATLTINSNAANSPVVILTLRGTGILPHIVVTPPLLLFDSTKEGATVCKAIDIWNPGTDTLRILINSLTSNDGDFHYTGLTGTNTLIPPDHHQIVTVCFIPIQQGFRQARLFLRTNIIRTFETPPRDTGSSVTVDIRGTGVPFGNFGNSVSGLPFVDSAIVGVMVCRTDTLTNNGDADILVTGLAIAGGTVFSYSGLPPFPFLLKARSSVTFTICGKPDKQGLLTGTATISGTTSGSNISTVLPLLIFGFQPCIAASPITLFAGVTLPNNGSDSTICETITNCGDIAAVYNVSISGASAADYTVTPAISGTVAPHGGTTVFCVKYKPSAVGASPASLDVAAADRSTSVSVALAGAAGCAALTNTIPEVPNTGDNEKKQFTFTISNLTGTFDWTPGTPTITGTGASAFTLISISPIPIPPGGQATVTMQFHPPLGSQGSSFVANLSWPNGTPCGNVLSVDLNGASIQSAVKEANAEGFILDQSYPNPTQGKANFTYTTPKETEVRITLVDLTGKLVRTLITGRVSQGEHTVNFDAANLPSGTYMYMLESGSTRLVRQLILTK